jgi:hypothetical protein
VTRGSRKSGKKASSNEAKEQLAPADELRAALNDLHSDRQKKQRKHRGKQRHVDDYRELVLDSASTTGFSEALTQLVKESRQNRARLLPEEKPIVSLASTPDAATRQQAARQAQSAAGDLKQVMAKRGIKERTHYYSATERRETGEIDRTYQIRRPGRPRRPDPS